jgi:hypothetical protein
LHPIRSIAAVQRVCACTAFKQIVSSTSQKGVGPSAGAAQQGVSGAATIDLIVAGKSVYAIRLGKAVDNVILS